MILVVGSTGMVGSGICQRLAELGRPFKALVRESSDPAKVARLKELGATLAKGDLRDPASLFAAIKGAATIYHCAAQISTVSSKSDALSTSTVRPLTKSLAARLTVIAAFTPLSSTPTAQTESSP